MSGTELFDQSHVYEDKSQNVDSHANEELVDPRVQIELERLNTATDLINKLEIELDEARSNFRLLLSESSLRVNQLAKKLGACVEKARPYYEARMRAKQLQTQTQKAALRYERASSAHSAAKEMVYLAEEGLKKEGRCFDPAWQEMLNHATLRVNEAESERVLSQHEHQKTSLAYNEAEKVVQQLHQELKKSIVKSSLSTRRSLLQLNNLANQHQLQLLPYFEMKAQFNQLLEDQRKKVHHLEENVLKIKMSYADALHNLEEISDEIHQKRRARENHSASNERTEGVGAESPSYMWQGLKIPYHRLTSSSTSCNDIFSENLNTDDVYMSLPSKLKSRPGVVSANFIESNLQSDSKSDLPIMLEDSSLEDLDDKNGSQKVPSNKTSFGKANTLKTKEDKAIDIVVENDANFISNNLECLTISNDEFHSPFEASSEVRNRSPEGEEMPNHKFLAPDFNILRVQREEISDSESLASNDTADTLDDNQIECLLLDKVLPLDTQESGAGLTSAGYKVDTKFLV